ncbi:hypothetical protein D3C72_2146520 [compost metagenome]
MNTPEWSICNGDTFNQNIFTFKKLNKLRSQKAIFPEDSFLYRRHLQVHISGFCLCRFLLVVPLTETIFAISINCSFTNYCNIFYLIGVDQGTVIINKCSFPTRGNGRKVIFFICPKDYFCIFL